MKTNFKNYPDNYKGIENTGKSAESLIYTDPTSAISLFRSLIETISKLIVKMDGLFPADGKQISRIHVFEGHPLDYPYEIVKRMDEIRRIGNKAIHENYQYTTHEALKVDEMAVLVSNWFLTTYSSVDILPYVKPEKNTEESNSMLKDLQKQLEVAKARLEEVETQGSKVNLTTTQKVERNHRSQLFAQQHPLSESETRDLIDQQLRAVGWEADTKNIRFTNTRPQKGKNLAIAEWKFSNGERADYALFLGLDMVGIIEAKKYSQDVAGAINQAKDYAKDFTNDSKLASSETTYDKHHVPFIFTSNGRPYMKQFEEKSGIWFWDARNVNHHPRALENWMGPQDLKEKLRQETEAKRDARLKNDDVFPKLANRDYQKAAVKAVENAVISGKTSILLAMATGTGKTRTAISLMYRLLKDKRANRILYLVDRQSLAEQTSNAMKDNKIDMHSFSDIYGVKEYTDKVPDLNTRVQISTVQGMVQRLFNNSEGKDKPTPGMYDFIIVDEAHRGYSEDKEMTDDEVRFYDQNDYISQYRHVIDYFDAVRIGMTATPALQTVQIFGKPVYTYSYRQAVLDGYLMDHDAPYLLKTKLSEDGIHFRVGETVAKYDYENNKIEKEKLADNLDFDIDSFNSKVITEPFNKTIAEQLVQYLDPNDSSYGKTLVYCASDDHADMVVKLLKQAYDEIGEPVNDDAIMKITGKDRHREQHIKEFKNEQFPNIVTTVDLLTTGIDVPSICNIVFLRRVKSRILYEQMLGRATRLYDHISNFRIFDAVGEYELMSKVTSMNSVAGSGKDVTRSIETVYALASDAENDQAYDIYRQELIGKIQRKIKLLNDEQQKIMSNITGMDDLSAWARRLKKTPRENMKEYSEGIKALSDMHTRPRIAYISDKKDEKLKVERGYGNGNERPEDYLESFTKFVKSNSNTVPAMEVVLNRPKDLTIDDLRKINDVLVAHGFRTNDLQSAWKATNKRQVAASIIGFIRQAALGVELVSEDELLKRAMEKIEGMDDWTPRQEKWLKRIAKQIKANHILGPNAEVAFNTEAFKDVGGYKTIKRVFGENTDKIVQIINDTIYA
ncbi:type I restriction-modification system endonuclease [Limosilactobacillus reuteri]|uniref:type I restriction-modification system endonuclease n=1 Tax=Limosilactobacillus reuteri TaxID=1598 RepID=UPI000B98E519|nr:type I restriction-modification system endonuclease [Limosilactobacillus reuteri]OYS46186.1 type I restriction-modification system endonuclease [Limosilactobacillus reuteri]OYS52340.1 type I restriction-modification system endonuclease [Limosilactobacillus reuteri]